MAALPTYEMATLEIETTNFDTFAATNHSDKHITKAGDDVDEDELSPIEEVRLTVANTDDHFASVDVPNLDLRPTLLLPSLLP